MKKLYLSSKDFKLIKRAFKYTKPYTLKFLITLFCVLSGIGFGLVQPIIWGFLLKDIMNSNFKGLIYNIVTIASLSIVQLLIGFLRSYLFSYLSENIVLDIKRDMYKKTLDLPVKAFDEMRVGDFISRIHSDASAIADVITNKLLNVVIDILRVLSIGITVFALNTPMALIMLGTIPLLYIIFVKYGKQIRDENKSMVVLYDNYFSNISETILAIREIKSLGVKDIRFNQFFTLASNLKKKSIY